MFASRAKIGLNNCILDLEKALNTIEKEENKEKNNEDNEVVIEDNEVNYNYEDSLNSRKLYYTYRIHTLS